VSIQQIRVSETHGTRSRYTAGCLCTPCRAANAQYVADLRHRRRIGQVIFGARRDATDAQRWLTQLHRDGFTSTRLAHELGLHGPQVKVHPTITVRKHLRIQRVYQKFIGGAA